MSFVTTRRSAPAKKKPRRKHSWCVYMLECGNGHLYTGITGDLERRFRQHCRGAGARFTRVFRVKEIVYWEKAKNRSHALKREAQIKSWPRERKLQLVNGGSVVSILT